MENNFDTSLHASETDFANSHVHIIESVGEKEASLLISEGRILSEFLKTMGVTNHSCHYIKNKKQLDEEWETIRSDITLKKYNYIHWSSHGNETGVALQSNEIVSWSDIGQFLETLPEEKRKELLVSFSSCEGFNGRAIMDVPIIPSFRAFVGPAKTVSWSESAIATIQLYYSIFHLKSSLDEAVKRMNGASRILLSNSELTFQNFSGLAQAWANKAQASNPSLKNFAKTIIEERENLSPFMANRIGEQGGPETLAAQYNPDEPVTKQPEQ